MGEKSGLFDRILAKFIFYKARDEGLEREAALGLISGHTLNTDTNTSLDALAEPVKSLIKGEAKKVYNAANKLKSNSGQVDLTKAGAGKQIQTVAEEVDALVSSKIYRNIPEVKARETLKQIQDEIVKKNGW